MISSAEEHEEGSYEVQVVVDDKKADVVPDRLKIRFNIVVKFF